MDLTTVRLLGGLGALFMAIGMLFWPLGVAGMVLLIIAFYYASRIYERPSIFSYFLIAVILSTVGIVVVGLAGAALIGVMIGVGGLRGYLHVLVSVIALVVLLFTLFIVAAMLYRKGLSELAAASGTTLFSVAGLLYLIGAILVIVVVGVVLILVAYIVMAVAFFTMGEGGGARATGPEA